MNMTRLVPRLSGIVAAVEPGPHDECGQRLSRHVDRQLFLIAQEAHQHMVDIAERMRVTATPTIEQSIHKRSLLYFAALLNDSAGNLFLTTSHDGLRMTMPMTRLSYEYVARAIYYAQRKSIAFAQIRGIWPHMDRLFSGGVEVDMANPAVRDQIETSNAEFKSNHPEWTRPHDAGLLDILIEMYGDARGRRLYERWHTFLSPFVHGTFDGVGLVLGHDGNNTVVRPGAPIANTAIAEATRLLFIMTALLKREFDLDDDSTLSLFRRYIARREALKIRVSSPLPRPRKAFRAKS